MVNMMNKDLTRIFDSGDKRVGETNHLLASLYRKIIMDLNLRIREWDSALNRYYKSPMSRVRRNARDIASDKNNFNRAIAKDKISWNNFFKAICIMGPEWIGIEITLRWKNGKTTSHSVGTSNPMASLSDNHTTLEDTADKSLGSKSNSDDGDNTDEHISLRKKIADKAKKPRGK
jgi:hypothetical protein